MKIFSPTLFAVFLLCLPVSALAQELEVDPGDQQLVIKGWSGEDASFAGDVRVTLRKAQGTTPQKVSVLPSDLKRADGDQIGRQQVQVSEIALTPELPFNITIKLNNVKVHGEYKGKIELLLAGQPRAQAKTIELTVIANVRPALTLLTGADRVKTNIVNCTAPCCLAEFILPGSTRNKYELRFEKAVGAPLLIPDSTLDVKGEKTGFQLNSDHLKLEPPTWSASPSPTPSPSPAQPSQPVGQPSESVVEKRFINLPVEIAYSELPPDHYTGSIYLSIDGQSPALKVPVDVSVRVAPLWPLLFLIAGILFGKLAKFLQEKGAPAADALVAFNRVELRVGEADEEDQSILAPQLARARRLINENQAAQATTEIKLIDARLATLNELRTIEGRLTGRPEPEVKAVLDQIPPVRERIRQGEDEKVKTLVAGIHDSLVTLSTTMTGDNNLPDPNVEKAVENAKTAAAAANRTATIEPPARPNKARLFLARLSGITDDLRAEASLWVLRPLMWIMLLLSLTALGMKSLYVDNPIFGASAFDYISLVFWGLSSDVASRTIGSIKLGGAGG